MTTQHPTIQLPECILLEDDERQILKDAFLSYIKELEIKAKKDKVLTAATYKEVMGKVSDIIQKLHITH